MSEIENGGGNGGANGNGGGNGVGAAVSLAALANGGKHVSAFLLRRLAEAVDGFRGEPVFCRARFTPNEEFDFEVDVKREVAAFGAVAAADETFGVFGPFFTPEAKGPDRSDTPIRAITLTLEDGRVIHVDPKEADSLFWTVSAVEKFLVPYYASVNSALMANSVLSSFDREGMVCFEHGPNTEPSLKRLSDAVPASPDQETPSETLPLPTFELPAAQGTGPKPGLKLVSAI